MCDTVQNVLWFPDQLVERWEQIPKRFGYRVDRVPELETESHSNLAVSTDEIADSACGQDRSGFVVTGGTVIRVSLLKDLSHNYDKTQSWWAEIWMQRDDKLPQYEAQVEYRKQHSDNAIKALTFAFISSGAMVAHPKQFRKSWEWERAPYKGNCQLLRCSLRLAIEWPTKLLDLGSGIKLHAVCPALYPPHERYFCGHLKRFLGGVNVYSGPSFDSNFYDSAYLGIEAYGSFPRNLIAKNMVQNAIENGAVLLTY